MKTKSVCQLKAYLVEICSSEWMTTLLLSSSSSLVLLGQDSSHWKCIQTSTQHRIHTPLGVNRQNRLLRKCLIRRANGSNFDKSEWDCKQCCIFENDTTFNSTTQTESDLNKCLHIQYHDILHHHITAPLTESFAALTFTGGFTWVIFKNNFKIPYKINMRP